jgi:hypothetical protein
MTEDTSSDTQLGDSDLANCQATVGEYQACVKDSTTTFVNVLKAMPKCTELKASTIEATVTSQFAPLETDPASCQAVETKCPGFRPESTN